MDCVIPAHNVRAFACAVGCLSRIGKEMYIEFDPFQGLIIRTLNDAKSAFASFSFEPNFFERCTAPMDGLPMNIRNSNPIPDQSKSSNRRRRRGKLSQSRVKRKRQEQEDSQASDDEKDEKYMCRVPLRTVHSILRPRKGLISLRIRSHQSVGNSKYSQLSSQDDLRHFISSNSTQDSFNNNNSNHNNTSTNQSVQFQLSFEFLISTDGILRITRRINVADCTSMTAVAPRENCSEILSSPKTLLKMLSPLKKTAEVAIHIQHSKQVVSASSFHPSDTSHSLSGTTAESAANALLKTETTMRCDEFEEYHWVDDREIDSNSEDIDIPPTVNAEVTLVFGIKEVKAMLQFCSQASLNEDNDVVLFFEWGGRPVIFETEGEYFSGELIMATLDHKLLIGFHDE